MIKFVLLDILCGFLLGLYWGVWGISSALVVAFTAYCVVTVYGLSYYQAILFGVLWRRHGGSAAGIPTRSTSTTHEGVSPVIFRAIDARH